MPRQKRRPQLKPIARLGGRDAIWSVLRAGTELTVRDLCDRARVTVDQAREYLGLLTAAGIVAKTPGSRLPACTPALYRLVRDLGVEAPRLNADGSLITEPTDQERLWSAMKAMAVFSWADLMAGSGVGNATSVRSYVGLLHKAGYLAAVEPGGPNRPARYRLLPSRNTGPRPPAIRRGKIVWDVNLGRQVWPDPEAGS